jgi:hypothetical protein
MGDKEYYCEVCKDPNWMLSVGMCQSGIEVDGELLPAHVNCAEAWCAELIDVYKITSPGNGSYYEEFAENVMEMLRESDLDHTYHVTKMQMARGKYHALEEFQGF